MAYFLKKYNDKHIAEQHFESLKIKKKLGGYCSIESFNFFNEIIEKFKLQNYKFYYGAKNEYFINSGRLYFYDFFIKDLNLIIEYHGIGFHPNPNWSQNKWLKWKQPFTNKNADEVFAFDQEKKNIALNKNFNFIEIYSDEIENGIIKIRNELSKLQLIPNF